MLGWVVAFLVIAIASGILGFSGFAAAAAGMAQVVFYFFLGLLLVSLITFAVRR